jgi:putative phosphoribosyl transferase
MFKDRRQAGVRLAQALERFRGDDVVVLSLPRGGVPVADEVARSLGAPLDVIFVRKLGVPFQPEVAMGAIGEDGVRVLNDEVCRVAQVTDDEIARVEAAERAELLRRAALFRSTVPRVDLTDRIALIVDDGIATGSTAKAACRVARAHGARRVVLAAPVAPPEVRELFAGLADEVVTLDTPQGFRAVGQCYVDFAQVPDRAVLEILARAARASAGSGGGGAPDPDPEPGDPPRLAADVSIPSGRLLLQGHLEVPERPVGIMVFAHGSGSSRHSPRNRFVASVLNEAGLATLLFDLLTPAEEVERASVFDVELLAGRLAHATAWVRRHPALAGLPVGYFGASTGAAAALWAAATQGDRIVAVVSRGGRPDLAELRLPAVTAPTLLVVGGNDDVVIGLNRMAAARLRCEHQLVIVPGATHLFEEPGTLRAAADAAAEWFSHHMAAEGALPTQQ